MWNPVWSLFLAVQFFRLSSLFDDYPVLLTLSSEYRKHLPNLVNEELAVPLEPIRGNGEIIWMNNNGRSFRFLANFFRWKGRTVPQRFLLFEEDVKTCKKNCFRSLLPALNQAHLELQTKEFTAKYCCIKKDVWVNSFNGSRKILLNSFPTRPLYDLYRNQEQKFNKSHTSSYQSRFERFKYSQIFRRP